MKPFHSEILSTLFTQLHNQPFRIILSNSLILKQQSLNNNNSINIQNIQIRPIQIKNQLKYQFSILNKNNQIFHENKNEINLFDLILKNKFQQILFKLENKDIQFILKFKNENIFYKFIEILNKNKINLNHNREKNYLIKENINIPFLVDLNIIHPTSFKVLQNKFNKFKQINHFLDIFNETINFNKNLNIFDFGCGKSYLTFSIIYFLKEIKNLNNFNIFGIDLKKDMIDFCNDLVKKYNLQNNVQFIHENISKFNYQHYNNTLQNGDNIVISLHACNTATDMVIEKAVDMNAKYILCVPCCQHELFNQIKDNDKTNINYNILKYGIFKEKFNSLLTDSIRCLILEILGYKCNVIEFIDDEHTPKNILIKAQKMEESMITKEKKEELIKEYLQLKNTYHIKPYLERLIEKYL
ncbi:hypothetical protein ABK040_008119 [Willaertia magna]